MIKAIASLISCSILYLVLSPLSANALPDDSVRAVSQQLNSSTLFRGVNLHDEGGLGTMGLSMPFSTDSVNRLGRRMKFHMLFSSDFSESEGLLIYGDLASNEVTRDNESSQYFISDIWGIPTQQDFQNSKFILNESSDCTEGQATLKIFQGSSYYYTLMTKDTSEQQSTDFSVGLLDFLPFHLRDLRRYSGEGRSALCSYFY